MTSPLITDELTEKVARAIAGSEWRYYTVEATAALTAALPDIVEACAKVADAEVPGWHMQTGNPPARIATAIRSLSSQEK